MHQVVSDNDARALISHGDKVQVTWSFHFNTDISPLTEL